MVKSKILLPLSLCAALVLSACATAPDPLPEKLSTPDEFMDESVQELYKNVQKVYKTEYFALGIPAGWSVVSFKDQPLASSISVTRDDRSALVTIRVTKASTPPIEESCQPAADGFAANGLAFTAEPEVRYGTCTITATETERDVVLWLREDPDDRSAYSITYKGDLATVGELLTYLVGNEKIMQLMVQPL